MTDEKTAHSHVVLPCRANLADMLLGPKPDLDMVLPGLVKGTVGVLTSPGGVGKSYWTLQAGLAVSSGLSMPLLGFPVKQGKVLILSMEDSEEIVCLRIKAIEGVLHRALHERDTKGLDYRSCVGLDLDIMNLDTLEAIAHAGADCRLIVLDTLSRFHNLDENLASDMKRVVAKLEQLAQRTGAAVLYVHHERKGGRQVESGAQQATRGSSVLVDNARWVSFMAVMSESEARKFKIQEGERKQYVRWNISKQNYGAAMDDRWFKRSAAQLNRDGGALIPVHLSAVVVEEEAYEVVATPTPLYQDIERANDVGAVDNEHSASPDASALDCPMVMPNETPSSTIPSANNSFNGKW